VLERKADYYPQGGVTKVSSDAMAKRMRAKDWKRRLRRKSEPGWAGLQGRG
jgi:hypothetical protein